MALGQSLRYYRGNFNPEAAYQQEGGGNGIISMYNPQSEAAYIEAVAQRQGRFDTAKMAQAQEIARIGEMETYDLAELNKRLTSFESGVNNIVKEKYNGDYSAAANEIAKMIGTERSNPFYHFNKQKVEMGKSYLDAKMKLGANFMSSGNPLNVSFQDWQQGKTFEFTPINSQDIVQRSAQAFSNFAKQMRSDSGLKLSPEGQYFKNIVQYGFRDEQEALKFAQESGLLQQIYDSMPELQGVENQDAVLDAIKQGAYAGIGTTDTKYLANQGFNADAGATSGSTNKVATVGYTQGPKNAEGKPIAVPIHIFNPMHGTTAGSNNEIKANIDGINNYVDKVFQPGDVVGVTPKDSKLLKDLVKKELVSFAFVPTEDPDDFYDLILNIMGTPSKTNRNRTPVPQPISVKVADPLDKLNLLTQFSALDPSVYRTLLDQLKEVNPEGFYNIMGIINEAKTQ